MFQDDDLKWSNCGSSEDKVILEDLHLTPSQSTIHFPSKTGISFSARALENITAPNSVSVFISFSLAEIHGSELNV